MSAVYKVVGCSKQSHHYHRKQEHEKQVLIKQIRQHIQQHRTVNRSMGLKKLYHLMPDCLIGRDQFIDIALGLGLGAKRHKKRTRTTFSVYTVFENLIASKSFKGTNQVWVSDITYVKINNDDAYVVFIFDIYSRMIVGYNASLTLAATENIKALKMAFRLRKHDCLDGLVHHSDRGSQYIAADYLMMLQDKKIQISMCDCALDNAYAERINGIVKQEYLDHCAFENLNQLQKELKKAVEHYNHVRPHWALQLMSPVAFEKHLKNVPLSQRTTLTVAQAHT
jgi:putative transposase